MTVGSKIKFYREALGLSQGKLSRRAEVTQQLISQLEHEHNVSTRSLPAIARALGVQVKDLDVNFQDTTSGSDLLPIPVLSEAEVIADAARSKSDESVSISDLPYGDWIALMMTDDAMDRVAPPGALIIVNRADRELEDGGLYLFSEGREVKCRRYRAGKSEAWLPFSVNPEHFAEPYLRGSQKIVGRCRRSVLEF
jgi:transcriptional regulator with XRE-family HTH domain